MTTLNSSQMDEIAARHPAVFHRSFWQRFRIAIITGGFVLYALYCWWFFAIGHVLGTANWNIAGTYLADWVSYEVRPEVAIEPDGAMKLTYPRFSPLGPNAKPDWVEIELGTMTRTMPAAGAMTTTEKKPASIGFMGEGAVIGGSAAAAEGLATATTREEEVVKRAKITLNSSTSVEVVPERVTVQHAGETLVVDVDGSEVKPEGTLPAWATQKTPGQKITLAFGFAGWGEIEADDISIRKRFLGWANFLFDTNSPFHGKSTSEVASLITSDERIDPKQSNLSLAWDNILYNSEWQHLDVWTKLLQTIVMAFVGTLFAMLLAFPLAFLAARNITRNWFSNQITKRLFDFLRSVDMLIWALFFTRAFGPGPLAGMSAIFFTDTGTLGKLYSEALENIDDKQREGVKSVGAAPVAVQRFGVLPQVMPLFASQALYFWESNTRSATIIGAVGAGGIGLKLWEAMRTNSDWENVAYMVLLILMVVFVFDGISNALRSRLMGKPSH
ncbi:phosphonate ABC transporter, permease protein PhnE [Shinella sp. CPCC 100929]|uniref:Phosphonate ABC transporter, permease protein PhnE n=1 Tax=Shinella lacus TaxID=2654216 RepID=A0ABT1R5V1_9HYPH|nr:phosphonate ABC transporter, permease protein PhnE [Shinella lacus]MCQ4630568.1 phosphonate ABC transporter, permease protein PhnE [Shinella lacus]